MNQNINSPKYYFLISLILLSFQFIGKGFAIIAFFGILLLFGISVYYLISKIFFSTREKSKVVYKKCIIRFLIATSALFSTEYLSSSTFIVLKNIDNVSITHMEYVYVGDFIGTDIFIPNKSQRIVFKVNQLESNDTKLVRINKYKYRSGFLRIVNKNKDTTEQIIYFRCNKSIFQPCIFFKKVSFRLD